jgi:hypothetical protein
VYGGSTESCSSSLQVTGKSQERLGVDPHSVAIDNGPEASPGANKHERTLH